MAEQRELIEVLVQVKEERERLYEQAQRGLVYKPVDVDSEKPPSAPPVTIEMMLNATPNDLPEAQKVPKDSKRTSMSSQASIWTNALERPMHVDQLLNEYTRLQTKLIQEVHSEEYRIEQDSRARIQSQIDDAHRSEIRYIHESKTWPFENKISRKRKFKETNERNVALSSPSSGFVDHLSAISKKTEEPRIKTSVPDEHSPKDDTITAGGIQFPAEAQAAVRGTEGRTGSVTASQHLQRLEGTKSKRKQEEQENGDRDDVPTSLRKAKLGRRVADLEWKPEADSYKDAPLKSIPDPDMDYTFPSTSFTQPVSPPKPIISETKNVPISRAMYTVAARNYRLEETEYFDIGESKVDDDTDVSGDPQEEPNASAMGLERLLDEWTNLKMLGSLEKDEVFGTK